tara:strand:+ start:2778 stop:5840 length:3063 start_codon:yes stop_codon:yes gene_type:complete
MKKEVLVVLFMVLFSASVLGVVGDFNSDGCVDFNDFSLFARGYSDFMTEGKYDGRFDLDGDGKILFSDFVIFAQNFDKCEGKKLSEPITQNMKQKMKEIYFQSLIAKSKELNKNMSGYIVRFSKDPLLNKRLELQDSMKSNEESVVRPLYKFSSYFLPTSLEPVLDSNIEEKIEDYVKEINETHEAFKKDSSELLGKDLVMNEFKNIFNGFALSASESDIKKLKEFDYVAEIYPNHLVNLNLQDSIPLINADRVWRSRRPEEGLGPSITGRGVTIAIIDTGVDYTHPDLQDKVVSQHCYCSHFESIFGPPRKNCCPNGQNEFHGFGAAMDDQGHGTHVAATAAGNGVLKGVAPDADLLAYKVLDDEGGGIESDVIAAIDHAVDPNNDKNFTDAVDIISMSVGFFDSYNSALSQTINNAVNAGVISIIAAANSGPSYRGIASPGNALNAITVGASDKVDNLARFSSRGPILLGYIKPDLTAPGVDICAAQWEDAFLYDGTTYHPERQCLEEDHVIISGTSMATPHVAGAAALLLQSHRDWGPNQIKSSLMINSLGTQEPNFKVISYFDNPSLEGYRITNEKASEICLKTSFDRRFENLKATIIWEENSRNIGGINKTKEIKKFVLYSDLENEPYNLILEKDFGNPDFLGENIIRNNLYRFEAKLDSVKEGTYWSCIKFDQEYPLEIFDYNRKQGNNIYNFEKYQTRYLSQDKWIDPNDKTNLLPYFFATVPVPIYLIDENPVKATVLDQGAGRIDILKSVSSDVVVIPSSLYLQLSKETNSAEIGFALDVSGLEETSPIKGELDSLRVSKLSSPKDSSFPIEKTFPKDLGMKLSLFPNTLEEGLNNFNLVLESNNIIEEGFYHGYLRFKEYKIPFIIDVDYTKPEIRGLEVWFPYVDKNEVIVFWSTSDPSISKIHVKDVGYLREENTYKFSHKMRLENLPEGMHRYYITAENIYGKSSRRPEKGYYIISVPYDECEFMDKIPLEGCQCGHNFVQNSGYCCLDLLSTEFYFSEEECKLEFD